MHYVELTEGSRRYFVNLSTAAFVQFGAVGRLDTPVPYVEIHFPSPQSEEAPHALRLLGAENCAAVEGHLRALSADAERHRSLHLSSAPYDDPFGPEMDVGGEPNEREPDPPYRED